MRGYSGAAHLLVCRCCVGESGGWLPVHHCQRVQLIKDAVSLLGRLLLGKAGDGRRWRPHYAPCLFHIIVQQPAHKAAATKSVTVVFGGGVACG